ncbi:MAG: SpaA isopeptide-forming pilin-related protein [Culicoidibacterales bacterium]
MKKMQKLIGVSALLGAMAIGGLAQSAAPSVKNVSAYSTYEEAVTQEEGTLVVKKVDKYGRPVAGAKFNITSVAGEFVMQIVTNRSGVAKATLSGAYYNVTDASAVSAGYYPGNTVYEVLVQPYQTKTITFTNSYKG